MYIRIDRRSQLWFGSFVIGGVMASGTLFVLDASLPGGFVVGSGSMRYAQTMAFTTLMVFQLFNVLNARAGERSAFKGLFTNRWVWAAIGLSVALQVAVIAVSAASVFDSELEFCRLVTMYDGGKLGAVAARTEQSRNPGGE
jgi:magnesium-transporting ATPase (P-type)